MGVNSSHSKTGKAKVDAIDSRIIEDEEDTGLVLDSRMFFGVIANSLRNYQIPSFLSTSTSPTTVTSTVASTTAATMRSIDRKALTLYHITLDSNIAAEVVDNLHKFGEIELHNCSGPSVSTVIEGIFATQNIQRVAIFARQLDSTSVKALKEGLRQLQRCDNAKVDGAFCPGLRELCLHVDLSAETTCQLFEGINSNTANLKHASAQSGSSHPPLHTLDLSQCDFSQDAVDVLIQGLSDNRTLGSLKLENCRLEDDELSDIVTSLVSHPTLEDLVLSQNYLETTAALVRLMTTPSCPLKRLDISQQNPGVLDLSRLAQALQNPDCSLEYLNLRESFVTDAHVAILGRALTINTTLQEVHLENCDISDVGAKAFLRYLPHMHGLKRLHWKDNRFSSTNLPLLQCLHDGIESQNRSLIFVDQPEDNSKEAVQQLQSMIRYFLWLNACGRVLLASDSIPLSLWPRIISRTGPTGTPVTPSEVLFAEGDTRTQPDAIFFLLMNGPILLNH